MIDADLGQALGHEKDTTKGSALSRAEASVNAMYAYVKERNLPKAQELLDSMAALGDAEEIILCRAKAAITLVYAYARGYDLPKAQALPQAVPIRHRDMILKSSRASFRRKAIYAGDIVKAQAVLDSMDTLWSQDAELSADQGAYKDIALWRAEASFALILACQHTGDLAKALEILLSMGKFGDHIDLARQRAMATTNVLSLYGLAGDLQTAQQLFDTMLAMASSPHTKDDEEIVAQCALAASNVFSFYGRVDDLVNARKILDSMASMAAYETVAVQRATLATILIEVYCEDNDLAKAQELFDATADLGICAKRTTELAEKLPPLLANYSHVGDFLKAQELFDAMAGLGDHKEIALTRAESSLDLIGAYLDEDDLPSAQKIYDAMANLGDYTEMAAWRIKATEILANFKAA